MDFVDDPFEGVDDEDVKNGKTEAGEEVEETPEENMVNDNE